MLVATAREVSVDIVVRWLPSDIAAGVSDLEIWDVVSSFENARLLVHFDLHAKYFRADETCLVGSANLTGAALGLSARPNLELLISAERANPVLSEFESELFAGCVVVDQPLVDRTREAAELMLPASPALALETDAAEEDESITQAWWIPTLRRPEDLYVSYSGEGELLSDGVNEDARDDLRHLRVPRGLNEPAFNAYVGVVLIRSPAVVKLEGFLGQPRRFGEVRRFLESELSVGESADRKWQALFRWLIYFLPDRFEYRRGRYSEVIAKRED